MKKIFSLLLCVLLALNVISQVPEKFNYQGVLRNSSGELVKNTSITVKSSLLQGSTSGTVVYSENHTVTTNNYGQFTVQVGGGTVLSGTFSSIDWSQQMYQKTEVANPTGGLLVDMGTTQLISVPYSIYSNKAKILDNNLLYFTDSDTLFAVKDREGNIVFAVFPDGAKVYTPLESKGKVGGFAISGRTPTKAGEEIEYFRVTPDSTRVWVNDSIGAKGKVGGFAISGRTPTKGVVNDYLFVTPDSTRIYVNDTSISKGKVGGFAISGRTPTKSEVKPFMDITKNNYFIGHEAGKSITDGLYNSYIGYEAGYNNLSGKNGIFIGFKAGYNNTTGNYNTFIGNYAGFMNTEGYSNVFIGDSAGKDNTIGHRNIMIGKEAGIKNTEGALNILIGEAAGYSNTTGYRNVFIGPYAGNSNTTGNLNTFIGTLAGTSNTKGVRNVYIGQASGWASDSANYNVFIGDRSGLFNISGSSNVYLGWKAGEQTQTGSRNIYIGEEAGFGNQSGEDNIFIGRVAGRESSGLGNIFIGPGAGYSEAGSHRLYIENSNADANNALIYGEFDVDILKLNAAVNIRDFMVIKPRDTAPENPEKGTVYFDNIDNKLKVWDGATWQSLW